MIGCEKNNMSGSGSEMKDIHDFVSEAWDDVKSPTTSDFTSKLELIKGLVNRYDQVVDVDRSNVSKLRKSVKAVVNSGNSHIENEKVFSECLEKLGQHSYTYEQDLPEIAEAYLKLSIVAKEVSNLMKVLVDNLHDAVLLPLDALNRSGMKETHIELKKSFEKAYKDMENRFHKVEKEKLRTAESAGFYRKHINGSEVAEDIEKERKLLQLQTCEYLLKVNESRSQKGVDLLEHFIKYYEAQTCFFRDGMQTINHFNSYVTSMIPKLEDLKVRQELEKNDLMKLRETLKSSLQSSYKEELHHQHLKSLKSPQIKNSQEFGTELTGHLLKKSEGKIKKVWQKRKCIIRGGIMSISHSDESKPPVRLNLLTCQAKVLSDDLGKKSFDLLSSSNNRTYHFQAEDEMDMIKWISVLNNAKEEQLLLAFSDENKGTPGSENIRELQKHIISEIHRLPGNDKCCDCGKEEPEWLSVNFGVLICLECCGVHRELGVHISRTQSLVIDDIGTSQLLIAGVMSNQGFNEIIEATLNQTAKDLLIRPNSKREERKNFITAKYVSKGFVIKTCANNSELESDLYQAVAGSDLHALLQVFAEGIDLMTPLTNQFNVETALHQAIKQENGTSLFIIDFLVQNSDIKNLATKDMIGDTALHVAADYNQGEAMKLILRANTNLADVKNNDGKTALDLAKDNNFHLCIDLLQHALEGKTRIFENVNIDWLLMQQDYADFSDDDLDALTPEKEFQRSSLNLENNVTVEKLLPGNRADAFNGTGSKHSMRKKTEECSLDKPHKDKKHAMIERSRRKTADTIFSFLPQPQIPGVSLGKTRKSSLFGHYRAVSDHSAMLSGGDMTGSRSELLDKSSSVNSLTSSSQLSLPLNFKHTQDMMTFKQNSANKEPPPLPIKKVSSQMEHHSATYIPPPPQFSELKPNVSKPAKDKKDQLSKSFSNFENTTYTSRQNIPNQTISEPSRPKTSPKPILVQPPTVPTMTSKFPSVRQRCRALYNCKADNPDELSFTKDEVIVILRKPVDSSWWEGEIDGNPKRRGLFPTTHVTMINEI